MKSIQLNVPDEQAEKFAEKLAELIKEYGGNVASETKEDDLYNTDIPVWERVKTVADAILLTGMELPDNIETLPDDIQAYLKLRVVCAAYNGLTAETLDQFPKFTKGEWRYYPWFELKTQEEIDAMDVMGEKEYVPIDSGASCGLSCARSNDAFSASYARIGARLAFKTRESAAECGKRFLKLWAHFVCIIPDVD